MKERDASREASARVTLKVDKYTLRAALAAAQLNQQALARKLKAPPTSVSDWLRGAHPTTRRTARRIEKILGITLRQLRKVVRDER